MTVNEAQQALKHAVALSEHGTPPLLELPPAPAAISASSATHANGAAAGAFALAGWLLTDHEQLRALAGGEVGSSEPSILAAREALDGRGTRGMFHPTVRRGCNGGPSGWYLCTHGERERKGPRTGRAATSA